MVNGVEQRELKRKRGIRAGLAKLKDRVDIRVREKAIERAKTRIYLHGRKPEDYDQDVLEVIVKEEEDKIKSEFKDKSILLLLAALGLSFWT
ncbi:dihydrouridine synthase [Teredinibacter haidensis]|uniref:dihydrouridine synthase n=1 Tax=Teredinibacter haidensis TaxID=2731755 RepID=UPI000948A510|nr:dihydrouridine synthase [Teredinibacter haidensis]